MIKILLGFITNTLGLAFALTTLLIVNGCATLYPHSGYYKISMDGYKESSLNVTRDARIYVYKNNQASNVLLEKEVVAKIKTMLRIKGYILVDKPEDADYLLAAVYGIGSEIPVTSSTSGSNYELNVFTGQFDMVPNISTSTEIRYPRYLRLILYDAKTL